MFDVKRPSEKSAKPRTPRQARSGAVVEDAVSGKLRAFYAAVEHQPVPQNLLDLLDQLDEAGSSSA